MSVVLDEVIVQGFKIRPPEDHYEAIAFRSFDYKKMEEKGVSSVEELLRGIAGLRISSDGYFSYRQEDVGLFIDGVCQTSGRVTQDDFYSYLDQPVIEENSFGGSRIVAPKLSSGHTEADLGLGGSYDSPLDIIERIPFDMIRRVDFIQKSQAVIFGTQAPGGAIMITTKRGNEIESSNFRSYRAVTPLGYQQKAEFYSPKYDTEAEHSATVLDLRPTLYWNPCVSLGDDGRSEISFYASDSDNTVYDVRIEGVTDNGEVIQAGLKIEKK